MIGESSARSAFVPTVTAELPVTWFDEQPLVGTSVVWFSTRTSSCSLTTSTKPQIAARAIALDHIRIGKVNELLAGRCQGFDPVFMSGCLS